MAIPKTIEGREYNKFVESPTRGHGFDAVEVVIGNDVIEENCSGDKAIRVVVDNGGNVVCESSVFNLIAGVPLVISGQVIEEICDATFYKDNGKQVFIGYKNLNNSIEVCSNKNMINLVYKLEGKRNCP